MSLTHRINDHLTYVGFQLYLFKTRYVRYKLFRKYLENKTFRKFLNNTK